MKIKLKPVRMDELLTAHVSGDSIILNDSRLDFGPLREGETLPADAVDNKWVAGDVQRINGDIHLTLILPHGANAPLQTRFPAAAEEPLGAGDGKVILPPYDEQRTDEQEVA